MVQVLVISLLVITTIYLLINGVFIRVLAMERMAASDAVGVDLMRVTLGEPGVFLIGVLVALAALTSVNATIFTGARTHYALGRAFKRSEERRVGNECVSTCRSRWSPNNYKKKTKKLN